MRYPAVGNQIQKFRSQQLQMQGINLTDNYREGQLEASKGIVTDRYPYITTADRMQPVEAGIPSGYHPVSLFAWERLFVVSDEPGNNGGYKCYYGGKYCGDAVNLTLPKQYAVVNSKLVMWPDQVYFNLYDEDMSAHPLTTAPRLTKVITGNIKFRKAVTS